MGLRMLLLLRALLLHSYILPSCPVLLHIAIYCTCFSTFWHCHPYIPQHFNGNVFILFIGERERANLTCSTGKISWYVHTSTPNAHASHAPRTGRVVDRTYVHPECACVTTYAHQNTRKMPLRNEYSCARHGPNLSPQNSPVHAFIYASSPVCLIMVMIGVTSCCCCCYFQQDYV